MKKPNKTMRKLQSLARLEGKTQERIIHHYNDGDAGEVLHSSVTLVLAEPDGSVRAFTYIVECAKPVKCAERTRHD